jgi:phosphohistidine swiveling domain-containing protein
MTTPHAIERYFESKIKETVVDKNDLSILLSPVYIRNEEMESLLNVALYAKKHGKDQRYQHLLMKHWETYSSSPLFSLNAQPLTIDYFADEVKNILATKDPEKEMVRMKTEENERIKKLTYVLKKIKANSILQKQVHFLQEYIQLRTYRKNIISQAHFYHMPLLNEIAKRMKLTTSEIKFLDYPEILHWLEDGYSKKFGFSQNQIKTLINKRMNGWAILMWKGKIKAISGMKNIIATIEQYQIVHSIPNQTRTIQGNVACRGKVRGRVKIVRNLKELSKVEKGDILVAKMTTPDFMVAINRAVAIVTDEGGVTCHAAIVAREYNIPCIIGTKIATKTLSDNDLVEVDAFEGKVRILETITVPEDVKILSGKTIYKGKVRGVARIVLDSSDFPKVQPGDILITSQTTSEYFSLLYRVNGFVVDEDSLTSHAVVCGKALKIPSLMATQFARTVLEDGEHIELDATHGLVKRLDVK